MRVVLRQRKAQLHHRLRLYWETVSGSRTDRNQWKAEDEIALYQAMMEWTWDQTREKAPRYFQRLLLSVDQAQGRVLELGCGIGNMTNWLAAKEDVEWIWAVDGFQEGINYFQKYKIPKTTALVLPIERLEFQKNLRFDTVMICELVEHLYPEEEMKMRQGLEGYVDSKTRYVISTPIGWMVDRFHVQGFSKRKFIAHLQRYYGEPVEVNYASGYSQVAWGYFNS